MKHLYKLILGLLIAIAAPVAGFAQSVVLHDTIVCESYQWFDTTLTTTGSYGHVRNIGDSIVVDSLDLTVYYGTYRAFPKDTCGGFVWHGTSYGASGVYTYPYSNEHNCPSADTLHLTINRSDTTEFSATDCNNYAWEGTTYTESGDYTKTLTNAAGCDSIVTLHLTINRSDMTEFSATDCNNYAWEGTTYTESGDYTKTLTNAAGCDSIVTLHLTINTTTYGDTTVVACESFTWIDGITYTESTNTPTYMLTNAAGCDSIVTLHLTINHPRHTAIEVTACESYFWNGTTYTENGDHMYPHPDANGCPQVDTLHLTIYNPVHTAIHVTACESFTWQNATYTASGRYTYAHQDAHGCWQVDTLHLTVNQPTTYIQVVDTCESFTWMDGNTYTESTNTPTYTLTNAANCDSIVTLHLTIHHGTHTADRAFACERYTWHNSTYCITDTYTYPYTNANGCESVDTLHLTIYTPTHYSNTVAGTGSYTWVNGDGQEYTASGTYFYPHPDNHGCMQVDTLHLTITPISDEIIDTAVCASALPYLWHELPFYTTGNYTYSYQNASGNLVVAQLNLTVNPLPNLTIGGETSFCEGESTTLTADGATTYSWNTTESTQNITVSAAGTYSVTGTDGNGCVNTATFAVAMNPLPTIAISGESAFCEGESTVLTASGATTYTWNTSEDTSSVTVNAAGTYSVMGTDANGCANTATFEVAVNSLPNVAISGEISFCTGESTTLSASGATTYSWNTTESTESIVADRAATYRVVGTDENGCVNSDTVTITENPLPEVTISGESAFCAGESTVLTASGATNYSWSTAENTPSITVNAGSTYSVTGTDANGCSNTATFEVVMNALPIVAISGESAFCEGESTVLTASGATNYSWSTSENTPSITVNAADTYSVTGTDANGCVNTAEFEVAVNALPTIVISGEIAFCAGASTVLTASGASTYSWNTSESADEITVNHAGSYSVVGTDENGCANTASVVVTENPVYHISIEAAICANELPYHYVNGQIDTNFMEGTPGFSLSSFQLSTSHGCDSTVTLALTIYPAPVPFVTGNMQFCSGEGTSLTVIGGVGYEWSTGETTDQIYVFEGNVYSVTVTDEYGCIASTEVVAEEIPSELEQKNVVSKNHADGTPYMLVYPQADLLYQWFKNGEQLAGETRQYYTPSSGLESNILYTVHVRPQTPGGCGIYADWSWDGTKSGKVSIVPNPNDGHFTLLLPVPAVSVAVYSATGEVVFRENMSVADRVDISAGLSAGLYFLKIIQEDGTIITEKLVINK